MKCYKIVILLIFLLLAAAVTPALADGSYNQVFESLNGSDGWLTEGVVSELEWEFINNPEGFLDALQKQDEDTQHKVIQSFAAWAVTEHSTKNAFVETIESVKDDPRAKDFIDLYEQALVINTNLFPLEPGGFYVDEVKAKITSYRNENFPVDEDFDVWLFDCYLLDGRLLARTMSDMDLTEEEISLLTERLKNGSSLVNIPTTCIENEVSLRLTDEEEQLYQKMVDTLESQDSKEEAQQSRLNQAEHVKKLLILLVIIIIFIIIFFFWNRQRKRC